MLIFKTVLVLWMGSCSSGFGIELSDVAELAQFAGEVASKVFSAWEIVSPESDRLGPGEYSGPEIPGMRRRERRLLEKMSEVGRMVGRVENAVLASTAATVNAVMRNLPDIVRLEIRLDRLSEIMADVSGRERELAEYIERGYNNASELEGDATKSAWRLERHTLIDFAEHSIAHEPSSVRGRMKQINALVAPQSGPLQGRSIFQMLREALETQGGGVQCDTKQSPQQLLLNLFSSVQLTQLQGFSVMQFSWMLLRLYEKGNFTLEPMIAAEQFRRHQVNQVAVLRNILKDATRAAWRCDPEVHVEGKTYEQVTRLLQGFLVNEVDLNHEESCKADCGFYTYAETYGCFKDMYCNDQPRCHGRLLNCQYFDADMWICPAANSTYRRYDWIEYENGRVLGHKKTCIKGSTKVDSWWRWWYHCSYCMCLCDEEGPKSDRYFSLRPVLSDVQANKVVTGIRLIKVNRVFHLQIEQGEVKSRGGISKTSLEWKAVDSFSLYGRQVREGQDYYKLDWEQRAIDLDDLVARPGYVLTGIGFRHLGGHLNLVIHTTPIDMETGRLRPDGSVWVDNDNTGASQSPRLELKLHKPDVPTLSAAPALPDSKPDMFIQFTNTDMEIDAAQTTVPYIDVQPVVPDPPILLSGAGLFHKGQKGYGGFIAPKVFTYDFSDHINVIEARDYDGHSNEYYSDQGK